ncbi:MAG: helix-turn-helix transcriptional regulator, partial [Acidimicrobiales bacterium]
MQGAADQVTALAALGEPVRRRIYECAAARPSGVSRDGAAQALGVSRSVVAFHLDKLVEAGLLQADFRRPPGRTGPGAGRPAKWYRRADGEITVSIPERRYELAAVLLAEAVERATTDGVPVVAALREVARQHGRRIGAPLGETGAQAAPMADRLAALLAEHGYEPAACGTTLTVANCPFHHLAEEHRDLVCAMNHELLCGVAEAAGLPGDAARLEPALDRCCVTVVVDPPGPAASPAGQAAGRRASARPAAPAMTRST